MTVDNLDRMDGEEPERGDDLLAAATRALRSESTEVAEQGASFTRARVMASLHQSTVKRRTRLAFVLPLAACFAAASAWGATSGKLPALMHGFVKAIGFTSEHSPRQGVRPAPGPARTPNPSGVASAAPAPVVAPVELGVALPAPNAVATPSAKPLPQAASRAPRRAVAASAAVYAEPAPPSLPPPVVNDEDADLYRRAHEAHFTQQNYAAALERWDEYLTAAPRGRLSLEARYNRALCLIRLGRAAEARDALAPFAAGKFGGYRQQEAAALRDALPE